MKQTPTFKQLIVLGASGFIGKSVTHKLKTEFAGIPVHGLSSKDIDLTSASAVDQLCQHLNPKTGIVFLSYIKRQNGDSLEAYHQNMLMVEHLCQAIQKQGAHSIINLSSTAVYGEDLHYDEITEATLPSPRTYYGAAKLASEHLLQRLVSENKTQYVTHLRCPLVYGIGDQSESYGPTGFAKKAARGDEIILWGDGTERREFLYVEDLAQVTVSALTHDFNGALNVVSGEDKSFKLALDVLSKLATCQLKISQRQRSKDKADHSFNNALLKKVFPQLQFTSLVQGMQLIWNEYRR